MLRRTLTVVAVVIVLLCIIFVFFVPVIAVLTTPPDFPPYSYQTTIIQGQTTTLTLVNTPVISESLASLSYCFWGYGALLQGYNYYPYVHITAGCSD